MNFFGPDEEKKAESKLIVGGRFAYAQKPPPKSFSNYSIKGDPMCL